MSGRRRRPKRATCPYCGTSVTGRHVGRTIYGWGCKDSVRCGLKHQKALFKAQAGYLP